MAEARLRSLWKALDDDASGWISAGEFGRFMRKGEAATFLAILLQGELGVRIGKGGGFPRRLHRGGLFGDSARRSTPG